MIIDNVVMQVCILPITIYQWDSDNISIHNIIHDANRYMEAIMIKLCAIYRPSPTK